MVFVMYVCVHCPHAHKCTVYVHLKDGEGCVCVYVSGDGGKLFEQDVLAQCVQRDVLPHIQTDGAHLETDRQTHLLAGHVSINTRG